MRNHGPALVGLLWRILGNEQDVCDTYQDTFLRLAHYEGGRKPNNVKAFLFRTASNTAISALRRRTQHLKACNVLAFRLGGRSCPSPVDEIDSKQLRQQLRNGITRLPENLRNVIVLRDLAELPYGQVANILGISVNTARVYRCRGIKWLSTWMARREDGENHAR